MPIPSLFIAGGSITTQQAAITVTSNNIANVNTTGFKRSTTTFQDAAGITLSQPTSPNLSRGGTNPIETGAGVLVSSTSTEFTQGAIKRTGIATDLAISGDAFFVLSGGSGGTAAAAGGAIQSPIFSRDGHFQFDAEGFLVNPEGLKVVGTSYYDLQTQEAKSVPNYTAVTFFTDQRIGPKDAPTMYPTDGGAAPNVAVPTPTNTAFAGGTAPVFDNTKLAELSVRGNLLENTGVDTVNGGDITITKNVNGDLLFSYDDANAGTAASVFTATVNPDRVYSDGVLTFDMTNANGNQVQMRLRLEPGVDNLTQVFQGIDYDDATGTTDSMVFTAADPATQLGTDITVADADIGKLRLTDVNSLLENVKIPPLFFTPDVALELQTVSFGISSDGTIQIIGPASERMNIGRIALSTFNNPDGLVNKGGNTYAESPNSGLAAISVLGGPQDISGPALTGSSTTIVSGALEGSNVNLANEFADLISYQRGLQASARVVSNSNEILQTIITM